MANTPIWTDVNSDYGVNVKGELVYDVEAVNNSLRNLLRCPAGSRRKVRGYGCYITGYLQEPLIDETAKSMFTSLVQSIERYETRIILDITNSSVTVDNSLPGYVITLQYRVIASGIVGILTYPLRKF